jgi:uncharacterized 2Fe-2S/4Fe-4S cluster protein (DUF4445 family)
VSKPRPDASVIFLPSGRRGRFARGTTLLHAAQNLGVDIDAACGGQGICGQCQVVVTDDAREQQDDKRTLSLPAGRRLSCLARVAGDLVVEIPENGQQQGQSIRKKAEAADIGILPVVEAFVVAVPEPVLQSHEGDVQRLCRALEEQHQLAGLRSGLHAQRQLQAALLKGGRQVTAVVRDAAEIIDVRAGCQEQRYGVAVDVGSTTVAAHLCDLASGETLASGGSMNPQIRFGEDLMSRVSYIMMNPGSEAELTEAIRRTLGELVAQLAMDSGVPADDIVEMTIVGNPIMHHLLLGISPIELGRAPFTLANSDSTTLPASELGCAINPGAYAYVLPCIAGHVGADAAAVCLAETPFDRDEISLIVDVGTNAELLLGNRQRLLAASSPTGPAFEGAQISAGQRAVPGAIERVRIDRETLEPTFKVIGCDLWSDDPVFLQSVPGNGVTGICGSGIIEAIGEMYLSGIIDSSGRILGCQAEQSDRIEADGYTFSYCLHAGKQRISILQSDVRAIQLAKASMYAGARLLMRRFGIETVDRIRLAGAFGSQIDVRYALILGMIPACPEESVTSAGNAAGTGARIALLNRASRSLIEAQVLEVEKIETAVEPDFQDLFVDAMALPTDHGFSGELPRKNFVG